MRRMRRRPPTPSPTRNNQSNRSNNNNSRGRKNRRRLPKWFNPNTDATGRFIVSIFRSDMKQAGRDIVDIIGELLDKR